MAHTKQENRRPGISKIFDEIKRNNPTKAIQEIQNMAKMEWTRRHGPGTAQRVTGSTK